MRFVVLGATGATGRLVVERFLAEGHEVVAYARHPEAVGSRPGVSVVGGTIDDIAALTEAMRDTDAVISCLGPSLNPQLLVHVDVLQRAVRAAVPAMHEAGVDRFVLMSAFGVGATGAGVALLPRLVNATVVRAANADKEQAEQILAASPADWSIVYPVRLTNGPATGTARVVPIEEAGSVPGFPSVSRADVAAVIVGLATGSGQGHRRIFVG